MSALIDGSMYEQHMFANDSVNSSLNETTAYGSNSGWGNLTRMQKKIFSIWEKAHRKQRKTASLQKERIAAEEKAAEAAEKAREGDDQR